MNNLRCPAYIEALLHIHTHSEHLYESPVNEEAVKDFIANGLAEPDTSIKGLRLTSRGVAYVSSLCLVPPPMPGFQDWAGNAFDSHGNHVGK